MAKKLTLEEELIALEEIKKTLEIVKHPTTSNELSRVCDYSKDIVERITCKYSLKDVLHGEEAIELNRKLSRSRIEEKHFNDVYSRFSHVIHQMYQENKTLDDILYETKLSRPDVCNICKKLNISFNELKERATACKISKNKQKLFDTRKTQIDSIIEELRKENIPLTIKQIQRKKYFKDTDIVEVLKNYPDAILINSYEVQDVRRQT